MISETQWVVGFLFRNNNEVALVKKTHPAWQAGKLNGVGGKIEKEETPKQVMHREFLEEAGADIEDWREYLLLNVQDGVVHFLVAFGAYNLQSQTEERVGWHSVSDLDNLPIIPNLA